jgi:hypothetical protein
MDPCLCEINCTNVNANAIGGFWGAGRPSKTEMGSCKKGEPVLESLQRL